MPYKREPRFCFAAPQLRQQFFWYTSAFGDKGHTLDGLLFDVSTYDLVAQFARPIFPSSLVEAAAQSLQPIVQGRTNTPQQRRRESVAAFVPSSSHTSLQTRATQANLAGLPVEIHYVIFDSLSAQELFNLGITCRRLWVVMMPVLVRRLMATLGTWAGTPVICTSHRHPLGVDNSYPPTLLRPEDLDELDEGLDLEELPSDMEDCYAWSPVNLFELAGARYDDPWHLSPAAIWDLLPNIPVKDNFELLRHPGAFQVRTFLTPLTFYPTDQEWVLRNLTTREFVRPAAVALDKEYIHGPFIEVFGFGEVILSRTVWHDELSPDIRDKSWAGHCLDIVPITDLDEGGPWKDISDQVAQDIERTWKDKLGDNWRTHIQDKARLENQLGPRKRLRLMP
ncbi:hypothetical protein H112_03226 [Trichophyton rubrum D6]|uniref:F-box domain-containing protein n=4 Tax=Trichophyton TaxID=5550 RepID=A0A178EVH4_TRIRU|nr:uncharacterized protein TERG_05836 [Trichophyton rubrum CBS 118892]EZF24374.1 hypothetical protein H100_03229 [Trichophyton rubrum MR850]EZF43335.1 hypothetical protein H102_03223 [Trichophyton rubrum CBS 100081]EZF53898.1 hypothetical protein H103_03237 [Trichophyton rubrum CBS 288.86]EZF64517.1 hypothetical protein H104_03220 [Trichophyton rubrum CBS 289.86]EZF75206.1 hypothetical protein H105_03241 [Trichophyton soudanense CBS 452.61]EZF85813.1 hypothetical protein H110_03231 [Trichophy